MEFVRSSDDFCAGYLQEDSDLEFSDCSEEVRYFAVAITRKFRREVFHAGICSK